MSSRDVILSAGSLLEEKYWISTITGTTAEEVIGLALDSNLNIYTCGFTNSQGAGVGDAYIVKYNNEGVLQWQRSLGGTADDSFWGITVDTSNNIYVVGNTASQGSGGSDILIAKYNTTGALQWQRSIGGAGTDYGYGIKTDTSGNIYISGMTASQGAGGEDFFIAKYNSAGAVQWQRSLGGISADRNQGLAVDTSGNVYVTGYTFSQGAGTSDLLVAKYNTTGVLQWQRALGGAGNDYGYGIGVDSVGNVYVTGWTASQGAGGDDILIVKYNTTGTLQWQRILGGSSGENSYGNYVDAAGNVYVIGFTTSGADGLLIAKIDTNGSLNWQRVLNGGGYGYGIFVDSAGNIYVNGILNTSTLGGSSDILVAKLPPEGTLLGYYGNFTYEPISLTYAISTLTGITTTLTDAARTLTDSARTLTDAARTLNYTTSYLPMEYWISTIGTTGVEERSIITVDQSGNIYVTGSSENKTILIKYNSAGVVQWQKGLSAGIGDFGTDVVVDSSGNIYITGTSQHAVDTGDVLIVKYNSLGVIQWQRTLGLGGTGNDLGYGLDVDPAGNVYIAGYTNSQGVGAGDLLIAKYNSAGTLQWQRSLGGAGTDYATGIVATDSGDTYLCGLTGSSGGAGGIDALLVKYSTAGILLWQRSLGGTAYDAFYDIDIDSAGNVYVCGETGSQVVGTYDVLIAKYNSAGTIQWQRTLGGALDDIAEGGISVDSAGNVYVSGFTASQGAGGDDMIVAKYSSAGTLLWQQSIGGISTELSSDVHIDKSGTLYVAGHTSSSTAGDLDIFLAKLPSSGELIGTYGKFNISKSTLTDAARTLTVTTRALTDAARTLSSVTSTIPEVVIDLPYNTITIPSDLSYWIATTGTAGLETALDIAVDGAGNTYISFLNGSFAKYNTNGVLQWRKTHISMSDGALACDSAGNVYTTGGSGNVTYIAKFNTDGVLQWQVSLTHSFSSGGREVAVDISGNVYITGQQTISTGYLNILTAKYNSAGTLQWMRSLGSSTTTLDEYGNSVAVDTAGNVYVAALLQTAAAANTFAVVKYNTSGVLQWQRNLATAASNGNMGIAVDLSGNPYVTGRVEQTTGIYDLLIFKYSSAGTLLWQRKLAGTGSDTGNAIAVTPLGDVFITGQTATGTSSTNQVIIARYSTAGVLQWQRTLGGAAVADYGYGIDVDSQGNIYIAGQTAAQGAGSGDGLIAKLPGNGDLTGTYGNFTYAVSALTDSAGAYTSSTSALTDAAATFSGTNTTPSPVTDVTSAWTSTTTII